jgi:hypothetical protein
MQVLSYSYLKLEIDCHNGMNFQGAKSELEELGKFLRKNEDELVQAYAKEQCNWKFIPAYCPHMGGLCEAGVKATKYHLKRVMGSTIRTFEQLGPVFQSMINF